MEVGSVAPAIALRSPKFSAAGPQLSSPCRGASLCRAPKHGFCALPLSSSSSSSSLFSVSRSTVRASSDGPLPEAYEESMEIFPDLSSQMESPTTNFLTSEQKALLAVLVSAGIALGSAEAAMALGPEGPLVEEFWDNMRRYGLYFLTVFTGGLYSLLQPIFLLLRNPFTAIFTIALLSGSFYLLYLLLNTMLGITNFDYGYA